MTSSWAKRAKAHKLWRGSGMGGKEHWAGLCCQWMAATVSTGCEREALTFNPCPGCPMLATC
jgi:hypothetical protein